MMGILLDGMKDEKAKNRNRSRPTTEWHPDLQCGLLSMRYDFAARAGALHLPADHCTHSSVAPNRCQLPRGSKV